MSYSPVSHVSPLPAAPAQRSFSTATLVVLAAAGALATLAGSAGAQDAHDAQAPSRSFTGSVGVGVATMPKYIGSDEYRVLPIPVLQLEYKGRLFIGGSQSSVAPGIGAYVIRNSAITWDVGLTGEVARPESWGDALAGMGKRSGAGFATSGLAYRLGMWQASAGAAVGLGKDQGAYGSVSLGTERSLTRRWIAAVSTGATFANATNMAFDFGVTPEQSEVRTALKEGGDSRLDGVDVSAYAPKAGIKQAQGSASLSYAMTPRSRVVLFAQGTRLVGEAARSPLAASRNGAISGVAIGYGF